MDSARGADTGVVIGGVGSVIGSDVGMGSGMGSGVGSGVSSGVGSGVGVSNPVKATFSASVRDAQTFRRSRLAVRTSISENFLEIDRFVTIVLSDRHLDKGNELGIC